MGRSANKSFYLLSISLDIDSFQSQPSTNSMYPGFGSFYLALQVYSSGLVLGALGKLQRLDSSKKVVSKNAGRAFQALQWILIARKAQLY